MCLKFGLVKAAAIPQNAAVIIYDLFVFLSFDVGRSTSAAKWPLAPPWGDVAALGFSAFALVAEQLQIQHDDLGDLVPAPGRFQRLQAPTRLFADVGSQRHGLGAMAWTSQHAGGHRVCMPESK